MRNLEKLLGKECFEGGDFSVSDFWRWSYSSLGNPFIRGYLAEFLVFQALKKSRYGSINLHNNEDEILNKHFATKMESDVHDLIVCQEFDKKIYKRTLQIKSKDSLTSSFEFDTTVGYDYKEGTKIVEQENWSDLFVLCDVKVDKDKCMRIKKLNDQFNAKGMTIKQYNSFDKEHAALVKHYRDSHLNLNNWSFHIVPSFIVSACRKANDQPLATKSLSMFEDFRQFTTKDIVKTNLKFHELRSNLDQVMHDCFDDLQLYSQRLEEMENTARASSLKKS
ncbi:hypothetical protein DC915_RS24855 [Vibrio parahaemolyticus]|nr:hypothetical protein [Vibrio parahaemolyticus]EJG0014165.1 hypothetical protein [Vibrio parahaemolyticus]